MSTFDKPQAEFIEFANDEIITSSCNPYFCPNMYGSTCSGHCYKYVCDDVTCPDDSFDPSSFSPSAQTSQPEQVLQQENVSYPFNLFG